MIEEGAGRKGQPCLPSCHGCHDRGRREGCTGGVKAKEGRGKKTGREGARPGALFLHERRAWQSYYMDVHVVQLSVLVCSSAVIP